MTTGSGVSLPRARGEAEVFVPGSLGEAVQALAEVEDQAELLAGGTELMARLSSGLWRPTGIVLDISRLEELRGIRLIGDSVSIGALTTFSEILSSPLLVAEAKLLVLALRSVTSWAIRNRATIGGNIMSGSAAADAMPPLLALGASVVLHSTEGSRSVPVYSLGGHHRQTMTRASEILVEVRFPRRSATDVDYYRKVGSLGAHGPTKVSFAGRVTGVDDKAQGRVIRDLRLGIGAVASAPTRPFETERFLRREALGRVTITKAAQILASEITPSDDDRSSATFRRLVAENFLLEFLSSL